MAIRYEVIGGAVVLRTTAGSAQYLYKGALLDPEAYTEGSVEHAVSVGLIVPVEVVDIEAELFEAELLAEAARVAEADRLAALTPPAGGSGVTPTPQPKAPGKPGQPAK